MAHEIEIIDGVAQTFSVGEIPWHKIGRVIDEAPSIADGIRLAGLDWSVSSEPLYLADGRKADRKAIVRDTDRKILGYSSLDWQPLQNINAFEFFQPWLDSGEVSLETAGSLCGGTRIWVLAKIKNVIGEIVKNDPIQRYFMLTNAHTAGFAVNAGFTDIRIVCKNTLEMASDSGTTKSLRVQHSKSLSSNLIDIQSMIDMSKRSFEADLATMQNLTKRGVNSRDVERFVQTIFFADVLDWSKASERMRNKKKNTIDLLSNLMENGSGSDIQGVSGTAYGLYQATTEFLTHYDGKDQDTRLQKLWSGVNQKRNKDALQYLLAV